MGEVELRYTAELVRGHELVIHAEVHNDLDDPVWIATPLVEIGETDVTPDEGKVYAYLDPDGVLQICRRLWPVPDDADVYLPEVPRFTRLDPGDRWRDRISVPLPVDLRFPYRFESEQDEDAPRRTAMGESLGVAFSIGYLVAEESPGEAAPEGLGRVLVGYADASGAQKIAQGEAVELRVSIKDLVREEARGNHA